MGRQVLKPLGASPSLIPGVSRFDHDMTETTDTQTEAADSSTIDQTLRPLIENSGPMRVYDLGEGEDTIFEVDTAFNGREGTLEFTAGELTASSGAVLELKITNTFFDVVDVESEDWRTIREIWTADENKEIIHIHAGRGQVSPDDAVDETGGVGA